MVSPTTTTGSPETGNRAGVDTPPPTTRWWRRPWVVPLAFLAVLFLVYSLPPYAGLDPSQSRVPPPTGVPWYYPALVTHIGFASLAMLTCVPQVWPWFRQRYPAAHRRIGRVYALGAVLPAGTAGLAVASVSPFGPVTSVSNVLLAALWLTCTLTGFRMARARRFAEHRRWMIRSFALTMSIITNRVWGVVWAIVLAPQLDTTFGGDQQAFMQSVAGLTTWTGWVLPLLAAQWWLDRRRPRGGRARRHAAA